MKSQPDHRPKYPLQPIRSIPSLCLALSVSENHLFDLARRANSLYRKAKPIIKADGSIRQPFDAFPALKALQCRIKDRVLKRVEFPKYLTGSLKGSDYRVNAKMHVNASIVICEDVEGFFPATTDAVVKDIWLRFFGFSEDVAEVLTLLTTKECSLPQGAVTSSYLANLAFWDNEAWLHDRLSEENITYSRYVDDITVSSKRFLTKPEQTTLIGQIYGMLAIRGYSAKRSKHEIFTSGAQMRTTKLVVNRKISLTPEERQNIRAAVYALENRVAAGERGPDISKELSRVASRVGRLGSLHPMKAAPLKVRLKVVRERVHTFPQELVSSTSPHLRMNAELDLSTPPWEN